MGRDDGLQDLGLDIGEGTFSELTVEAQATEAFSRFNHKVPDELKEKFMNAATCAVRRAASAASDPRDISVEDLIHRFEGILRDLLDGKDVYG